MPSENHFDVLIVGAGLSGISAAHHIMTNCPKHSYAILEARDAIGGTWDLFKYPGIRSDSDMYTLGYSFRPWEADEAIADGPAILEYINDTAKESGIDKKIKYNHKVIDASWSSEKSRWTLISEVGAKQESVSYSCNFLYVCSGYYDYDEGYTPEFEDVSNYKGRIVHPQKWTEDIDYQDKKVIVIGSGATAITLVPEMSKKAAHVTMLQRSPTYIISAPQKDAVANFLKKYLPSKSAYSLSRWKNILYSLFFFKASRKWPNGMRNLIVKGVSNEMGSDYDVKKHFKPDYNPWDQRVCLVPDSDLFEAIKKEKASVVTDHIDKFTPEGILTRSGQQLEADIIVTATGLKLSFMGGMDVTVDGQKIKSSETYCYRGMMFSDIPNLALAFGYTNASWTLKCDLTCEYVCRLLNYMDKKGYKKCVPRVTQEIEDQPFVDFSSGYIARAADILPKQGSKRPWKVYQNYPLDILNFRYSSLEDGVLKFK